MIECNSRLVSVNFSCAILDHFINSFGISWTNIKPKEACVVVSIAALFATMRVALFVYLRGLASAYAAVSTIAT